PPSRGRGTAVDPAGDRSCGEARHGPRAATRAPLRPPWHADGRRSRRLPLRGARGCLAVRRTPAPDPARAGAPTHRTVRPGPGPCPPASAVDATPDAA